MAPAKNADVTEWERARAENLKANKAALSSAVGATAAKIFRNIETNVQKKPTAPRRKVKAETPSRSAALPTRRSARVAGIEAAEDSPKRKLTPDIKEEEERAKKTRIG